MKKDSLVVFIICVSRVVLAKGPKWVTKAFSDPLFFAAIAPVKESSVAAIAEKFNAVLREHMASGRPAVKRAQTGVVEYFSTRCFLYPACVFVVPAHFLEILQTIRYIQVMA
eukprot:TRINITY_DN181187_c0_g1_i1.p1 TRINITY_DN181187_c0_g1~~TRINITY_DN181187_c0_g1_i1.p1  ORF type:complete len:112 (-),score=8.14 TRINITY_DN181187_c0_g1_i1:556-891(-)